MFKNYIILAWRVLGRKKFFTFISLFGISFTLGILMVIISFLQTELGTDQPWTNRDRLVEFDFLMMKNMVPDTSTIVDSSMVNGVMQYDTTYSYGENSNSTTISSLSAKFLLDHFTDLQNAENYSFYSNGASFNSYVNNSKIVLNVSYTDARYWELLDFEFLEGQAYDEGMFDRAEPVAVITDKIAKEYFGEDRNIVGRELQMDGRLHKVIGLIKKPKSFQVSDNVFVPSTLDPNYPGVKERYTGGYNAFFLAHNPSKVKALQSEIESKEDVIPMDVVTGYNKLFLEDKTGNMFEAFASEIIPTNVPSEAGLALRIILVAFITLFVLLPTLNLINLNVSRIMERSSEIGVRKAFGASKGNILGQFIFENVILTILGGLVGLAIAILLIRFINGADLLQGAMLTMNFKFFFYSFIVVILFGIISGFLPAFRMSKIHIVNALKSNKL